MELTARLQMISLGRQTAVDAGSPFRVRPCTIRTADPETGLT